MGRSEKKKVIKSAKNEIERYDTLEEGLGRSREGSYVTGKDRLDAGSTD